MLRNLFIVSSLMAIILSACAGQTTTETLTVTTTQTRAALASATATQTPDATETATAQPADTSTARPSVPTNPPDCTNSGSFVADVTIPDNSDVPAGMLFTKTWRVRNTGTCTWGPDYTLTHYSEEQMGAVVGVPLAVTRPGETVDISIELRAADSLGTHRGNFVIKNPAGLIMSVDDDSRLWVIISVTNTVTQTPTATRASTAAPGTSSGTILRTDRGANDTTPSGSGSN